MKKFRYISRLFCTVALGLAVHSCADKTPVPDNTDEKPYLTVLRNKFTIDADGGIIYGTILSNMTVSAAPGKEWCSANVLTYAESDNLRMNIGKNTGGEREAVITLSAEGCQDVGITVIQSKAGTDDPDDPKSSTCDLLTFRIDSGGNNVPGGIAFTLSQASRTAKAVYLTWIYADRPEMMIPTFTTNGERVLVDGEEIVSGNTAISFADDFPLVVEAENGDTKTYTVSLNCPQINTELAVMSFSIAASSITSKTAYKTTKLDMYSPHTSSGWWSPEREEVQIRGRGNSTWSWPKKPWRVKFPEKLSPIGFNHTKENDWVLLANDIDKSLLRNHVAFACSRILFNAGEGYHNTGALLWTPASQLVNVYFNGQYHGVYQMTDQVERAVGRMELEELTKVSGSNSEIITGGHFLETDIHSSGNFKTTKKQIVWNHRYPDPDDYDPLQWTYIRGFINTAESALYASNYTDPVNGWRMYFDEKTMADYIIIKELMGDMDGYTQTQIYKRRGIDKIFFGPVWDVDKGFGNDNRDSSRGTGLMLNAGFHMPSYVSDDWFQHVWSDPEFRKFVYKRWNSKKAELIAAAVKILDEEPAKMDKAVKANFARWTFNTQADGNAPLPANTYELEIERMNKWLQARVTLLDNLFNK